MKSYRQKNGCLDGFQECGHHWWQQIAAIGICDGQGIQDEFLDECRQQDADGNRKKWYIVKPDDGEGFRNLTLLIYFII